MTHASLLNQACIIVAGVSTTILLQRCATSDWRDRPDMSTVEMMTRPVSELVFPGVTVCPDGETPADPLAAVAWLLTPIKFQCGSKYHMVPEDECGQTEKLKRDFDSVLSFAFDTVRARVEDMFDGGEEQQRLHPALLETIQEHSHIFEALLRKNLTYADIAREIKLQFGRRDRWEYFRHLLREQQQQQHQQPSPNLNRTSMVDARKLTALAWFSLFELGTFGPFLSEVLPLMSPKWFSRHQHTNPKGHCEMPQDVIKMHELFARLTAAVASQRVSMIMWGEGLITNESIANFWTISLTRR